ncbi:hypothetical protein TNCT_385821 [Trichonephila clavata]|uniref:Uncharacterized protein n=1 Tax=Trichonephila clavata TaxID=2740835 RepID=A0A8X6H6J3_TRICU|nr:hypothetical protein TNCT_385821 [Trichonephila clavata]
MRASGASKVARTARLEERTSENAFFEVEEERECMERESQIEKKKCKHKVPLNGLVCAQLDPRNFKKKIPFSRDSNHDYLSSSTEPIYLKFDVSFLLHYSLALTKTIY